MANFWRGLGWTAALVVAVGAVGRAVFVDVWVIPDDNKTSAAVAPSMAGGDTVLYMKRTRPGFGDLVRCADPEDATRYVVGRVVGMSGDTVEVNGTALSVNGRRYNSETGCVPEKYAIPHPTSGSTVEIRCDMVSIGGHPAMRGWSEKPHSATPTTKIVGQGMLFLLSDDRTYHDDSQDFGIVPAESCTGRIVFRLWGKEGMKDDKRRMTFVQ